jgi:cytochrome P450
MNQQQEDRRNLEKMEANLKKVPEVAGTLPLVGHMFSIGSNFEGFIKAAQEKHGNVFKIKVGLRDIIIFCDPIVKSEILSASEKKLSMYHVLEDLSFLDGFFETKEIGIAGIGLIKKILYSTELSQFWPKIGNQASHVVSILANDPTPTNINKVMMKYTARTSASCFLAMEQLSDEFLDDLENFGIWFSRSILMRSFFPRPVVQWTLSWYLQYLRKKLYPCLKAEIEKYIADPNKSDSPLIRNCLNFQFKDNNTKFTMEQICNILICLLFVSAENTAIAATAVLADLATHPIQWNKIYQQVAEGIQKGDWTVVRDNELLEAAIFETARLTSHYFAINRRGVSPDTVIGGFLIGNQVDIALCEPAMMKFECETNSFQDPFHYYPERFLPKQEGVEATELPYDESKYDVITWSSGKHHCPGRFFARNEIKMVVASIIAMFQRPDIKPTDLKPLCYVSTAALAIRTFNQKFSPYGAASG